MQTNDIIHQQLFYILSFFLSYKSHPVDRIEQKNDKAMCSTQDVRTELSIF